MHRTLLGLATWVLVAAGLLAACNGGDGDASDVRRTDDGRVIVTLWHSMSSINETALKRIVDEFNASQTGYQVRPIFQGGYTDSLNKLIATRDPANLPALIQLNDTATQIMIDSPLVTPIQAFIDAEGYDLSDFEPRALDYYRIEGTLYSMAFNLAGPILYYDRQAFAEVGLDPDRPPRTLEEVREYSLKLVKRDPSGQVTRHGIALTISPWVFEQMLARQGALYVNNENGRAGRATEAVFDSEEGKRIIRWWDQMVEEGLATNVGRQGLDALLALGGEKAAMAIESTAALRGVVFLAAVAGKDPKRLGTGPLPAPEGEGGGIVLGGAAFWVLKKRPEEEQRGAWELIKFAASAEQQAQWHAETGYFPGRLSAYDLPAAVKARQDFPQFETAVRQLRASPDSPATRGALLGSFNKVRERVARAFEEALSGDSDPARTLERAADEGTEIIQEYNRTAPD